MKRICSLVLTVLLSAGLFSQSGPKNDTVFKLSGDELSGKVLEINDADIKFSYAGETLVYTIKKADILKIVYASGRTESYNQAAPRSPEAGSAATGSTAADRKNKIAVLPFAFIRDGQAGVDAMSEKAQTECFSFLGKHAGNYQVLDPRMTNAVLIKAGVNKDNIKGYTMNDLCNILGAEYVIDALVTVNKSTQTNYQSNQGTSTTKNNDKSNDREKNVNTTSYSTTTQEYETTLNLAIYNDQGTSIYNQQRKSLLSSQEAYKNTLEYLLKRTPLYSK